jgi:hypothetical protein
MRTVRQWPRGIPPVAAALCLVALLVVPARGQPVVIQGSLSNFDVLQNNQVPMDNFELDIFGQVSAADFYGYYPGWGIAPRFDNIVLPDKSVQGAEVMWLDRANPVLPGNLVHFGVSDNPALPPVDVRAAWTKVVKLEQIPVPFQWWFLPNPTTIIDFLTLSPTYTGPVIIQREWGTSPEPLSLEQLQYDAAPVTWIPFDAFTLNPGDVNSSLQMPIHPGTMAYLVRYTVTDALLPGEPVTRFVTEAVVPALGTPTISRILVNFDLRQPYLGRTFDNVELDFFGNWTAPGQILKWYTQESGAGMPAWGVDPLIRSFPAGMFPQMPDRGGIEVTWVDRWSRYSYGRMAHFGLVMDPAIMGPIPAQQWTWVQAYWTGIEKYPVPVPWQTWQPTSGLAVTDIITYSGYNIGPVTVDRQYVSLPHAIPLEDLTWDLLEPLAWQQVPGDPIVMDPTTSSFFDVLVGPTDRAALVRYTVQSADGRRARVINEALIAVSSSVPDGQERGGLYLAPPHPNPVAGGVEITFRLAGPGPARLVVTDVSGRQVAVLHDGPIEAGEHTVCWDGLSDGGQAAPSGVYFYTLTAGSRTITQRLVREK